MHRRPAAVWAFLLTFASAASVAAGQTVFDGGDTTLTGIDFDFQDSKTTIKANWGGLQVDPTGFSWAIGTTPGAQDVQAFTNVGFLTDVSNAGLTLTPGSVYYVTVRGDYTGIPFEYRSDGITVFKPPSVAVAQGTAPFTAVFTFESQGIAEFVWDFDQPVGTDGSISSPEFVDTRSGSAAFTYPAPGTYEATWRITHSGGETRGSWINITVNPSPQAPSVGLTAVPPTGPAPLTVNFTAPASTADGSVSAVLWDFDGDGLVDASSASSVSITHTFGSTGTFTTRVTVVDGAGNQASASQAVIVTSPGASYDPPGLTIVSFGPTPAPTGVPVILNLDVNPGPQSAGTVTSVEIDFDGDGNVDRMRTTGLGPPYPVRIVESFQYETPGTRPLIITVRDSDGFSTTTGRVGPNHTALLAPTSGRCWITQPVNGARVWGNHLSLFAQVVPESDVVSLTFEYRTPAGPWIPIGAVGVSTEGLFGVHWDVTGLTPGASYDLRALAQFGSLGLASSEAIQLITVQVQQGAPATPTPPYYEEFSGSPFTKLQIVTVNPNVLTVGSIFNSMSVQIPAGATLSYDQMRLERRAEAIQTVSGRLQALKLVHQRKLSFGANPQQQSTTLNKPSKVTMYVGSSGPILPDGTDLTKASLKIYRYEPSRERWEPLLNQTQMSARAIVQAQTAAGGNLAVVIDGGSGSGSSRSCGGLGLEGALVVLLLLKLRRR